MSNPDSNLEKFNLLKERIKLLEESKYQLQTTLTIFQARLFYLKLIIKAIKDNNQQTLEKACGKSKMGNSELFKDSEKSWMRLYTDSETSEKEQALKALESLQNESQNHLAETQSELVKNGIALENLFAQQSVIMGFELKDHSNIMNDPFKFLQKSKELI